MSGFNPSPMSRRGFLGLAAAAAAVPTLAACNVSGSRAIPAVAADRRIRSSSGISRGAPPPTTTWARRSPRPTPRRPGWARRPTRSFRGTTSTRPTPPRSRLEPARPCPAAAGSSRSSSPNRVRSPTPTTCSSRGRRRHVRRFPARNRWRRTRSTAATRRCRGSWMRASCGPTRRCWRRPASKRPPTSTAGSAPVKALKKIGVFGYGIGTGAGNNLGSHTMVAMMIMNGGGLFTPDGKADCVTDRNIEAMDLRAADWSTRASSTRPAVSYTTDNLAHPVGEGEGRRWASTPPACSSQAAAVARTI